MYTRGSGNMVRILMGVVMLVCCTGSLGCGGDKGDDDAVAVAAFCRETAPMAGDPRYGTVALILMGDGGAASRNGRLDCLWVGLNDAAILTDIQNRGNDLGAIFGSVIPDPAVMNGFYFDPATTYFKNGIMSPESQTSIDLIKVDPDYYTPTGAGGRADWGIVLNIKKMIIN
jgi:hypothetical protein